MSSCVMVFKSSPTRLVGQNKLRDIRDYGLSEVLVRRPTMCGKRSVSMGVCRS